MGEKDVKLNFTYFQTGANNYLTKHSYAYKFAKPHLETA